MTAGTARTLQWIPWVIAGLAIIISIAGMGDGGRNNIIESVYVVMVGYVIARLLQADIHTSMLRPNNERKEERNEPKQPEQAKTPPPIPS